MASERDTNRQEIESFERPKRILLGAVDTVFQIADNLRTPDRGAPSQSAAESVPAPALRSVPAPLRPVPAPLRSRPVLVPLRPESTGTAIVSNPTVTAFTAASLVGGQQLRHQWQTVVVP